MKKRKGWSKVITEHGVRVRLFERAGSIYRDVAVGRTVSESGKPRTVHDIASLGHRDRTRAEDEARSLCAEIAKRRLHGVTSDTLTMVQLHHAYVRECGDYLTRRRQREVDSAFRLLRRHVGDAFKVADLGKHQVRTYVAARQDGTLVTQRRGSGGRAVRAAAVAKDLGVLRVAIKFALAYKRDGRPLLERDPVRNVTLPAEPKPARPLASRERYEKMLEHADVVDSTGAFRTMLHVAWFTGRRRGSIAALRASDVLLTPDAVQRALADAGMDDFLAEGWPAALRWAAEADKEGVEWVVPIPAALASALGDYLKRRALVGGVLLFPARRDASRPVPREAAYRWFRRCEQLAKLPHQHRGGWHSFRRSWATIRKTMPLQDVMAAGGWRDPQSLQRAYQHADSATIRAVMDVGS